MTAIEVDHLVKRYRAAAVNAVDRISFDVPEGQLFCLLGPNGAGKTTTVSVLTTTLAPTSGRVRIAGLDLAEEQGKVRRELGVVFQQPSLDLNLTAEENIRLHAVLYGLYPWRPSCRLMPAAYRSQVQDMGCVLDLSHLLGRRVRALSGGQRRRLEIVRALMHRPAVLFLDEPTAGLDPESRRSLWAYLAQARAALRTTVFLTTHYLAEAEAADAVCVLVKGRIIERGSPAEVKARQLSATLEDAYLQLVERGLSAVLAGELSGVAAIAQRDVTKLLRDRPRLAVNLAFPVLLIGGLGAVLQPTVGRVTGLNAVTLAFTGVLAASLFQSAAAGMISIVEDRENDFSRELFVTPVSRLTLVSGKVAGETLVAAFQGACIVGFAVAFGVRTSAGQLAALLPPCVACCLLGGAFGLATIAALPNQRSAMQIFQFLIIPQYVLGGVLVPLRGTAFYLDVVAHLMPMRYVVELTRAAFYAGTPGYGQVVSGSPLADAAVTAGLFAVFMAVGSAVFGYRERTR